MTRWPAEIAQIADRGIVFWDDNIGAAPASAKELFGPRAARKWWTSQTTMVSTKTTNSSSWLRRCKALFVGLSRSTSGADAADKRHNQVRDYRRLLRDSTHGIALQAA